MSFHYWICGLVILTSTTRAHADASLNSIKSEESYFTWSVSIADKEKIRDTTDTDRLAFDKLLHDGYSFQKTKDTCFFRLSQSAIKGSVSETLFADCRLDKGRGQPNWVSVHATCRRSFGAEKLPELSGMNTLRIGPRSTQAEDDAAVMMKLGSQAKLSSKSYRKLASMQKQNQPQERIVMISCGADPAVGALRSESNIADPIATKNRHLCENKCWSDKVCKSWKYDPSVKLSCSIFKRPSK